MDNVALLEERQRRQNLECVRTYEWLREAHKVVVFHVLKKVFVQKFKHEALVLSEAEVL